MAYRVFIVCVLWVCMFCISGCGDSDSETANGSSGTSSTTAAPKTKPLDSDDSHDLIGAWFRHDGLTNPIGVEFSKDSKIMIVDGEGPQSRVPISEITLDYTMLDGGRMRLSVPGSPLATQVIRVGMAGSTLTLEPETQNMLIGFAGGTYTRLKKISIAERYQQELITQIEARAQMVEQLKKFMAVKQMALALTENAVGTPLGLELTGQHETWQGIAWQNIGGDIVQRQARVSVDQFDPRDTKPITMVLELGNVIGPPGAPPMRADRIPLTVTIKNGKLSIGAANRHLIADTKIVADYKTKYDAALAAARQKLDEFHAKFGRLVIAEGGMMYPNNPNAKPRPIRIAMMRVEGQDAYKLASFNNLNQVLMPNSFNMELKLVTGNDGNLFMTAPSQVQLQLTDEPDKIDFFQSGLSGRLTIVKTFTVDELVKHLAKRNAFVKSLASKPLIVTGEFAQSVPYKNGYVRPARLSLTSPDATSVTGTYYADSLALEIPFVGQINETLLGLFVKFVLPRNATHTGKFDESGTFSINLDFEGDTPVLIGRVDPGDSNNRIELRPTTPQRLNTQRELLQNAIKNGGVFQWGHNGWTGSGESPMTLQLQQDAAGRIAGIVKFRHEQQNATGHIAEENGMIVLNLNLETTQGSPNRYLGPLKIWPCHITGELVLSGYSLWQNDKLRIVSYIVATQ